MALSIFSRIFVKRLPAKAPATIGSVLLSPEHWLRSTSTEMAPTRYGEYYATSVMVYAAIKLRADAAQRVPFRLYTKTGTEIKKPLPDAHPYVALMRRVNRFWTSGDLWRATIINHSLWGSAFWWLRRSEGTGPIDQIWSLRPDKVRIIPDKEKYIAGYMVNNGGVDIALLPKEVVWFRDYNPLDELSSISPIAPLRLSIDMAADALNYNRNFFKNGLLFGNVAITTASSPTDEQIAGFYKALRQRFSGPGNAFNPIILNEGMDAKNLGFSPHEMEHIMTLRWSLEDVSRAYNIPKIMLGDLERSTYANVDAAERIFWRGMATYLQFLQDEVNEMLSSQFGDNIFGEFDLSVIEALQPDINAVALREREDVKAGIRTINEVRADRHLPPVAWGDIWWIPAQPGELNTEEAA